jgi:predicted DNA-binding transcriptional regulator YafY
MVDHRKIYRVFSLISRLRAPFGVTKAALAQDFDVSERTIERYFVLLQDLGFEVKKQANRYRIERLEKCQTKPEDLIVFSLEEAAAIKDAITNSPLRGPLQKSLLTKLYALTDIDEISDTLYRQNISKNISYIRKAIKDKEQLILKNYHSVSSGKTTNRLIEPIKFFSYYTYLIAFEVD